MKKVALAALRLYRNCVSPYRAPSCRFVPSCSEYAVEAVTVHGSVRGSVLTIRRLGRCGPWHPGGWDPVPTRSPERETSALDQRPPVATTEPHHYRASGSPASTTRFT